MIVVVGAGIAGLIAALRLAQRGEAVTIVDRDGAIGGLTQPCRIGDVTWDRFYHVVLESDQATRALLAEIGIADRLTFESVQTNLYIDGTLRPFSGGRDLLALPELSVVDKARLVATILHARWFGRDDVYEWRGVLDYLTRWSGPRVVERIWAPLLRAKLGEHYADASAAFIRATIKRLQGARRNGVGGERYGYVRGGYSTVLRALEERLRSLGVEFVLGDAVQRVTAHDGGVFVKVGEWTLSADRALLTVPSPVCAAIVPDLTAQERLALGQDKYFGVVCVSLLVNRRLGDAYVTNVADAGFPFTGIINMSALVGRSAFGGKDLVYVPKYLPAGDRGFADSNETLVAQAIESLSRVFRGFTRDDVVGTAVARASHVFPFPRLGRAQHLPPARTSSARIAIANAARLRYATLNVSDTITVVDETLAELDESPLWRLAGEGRALARSR